MKISNLNNFGMKIKQKNPKPKTKENTPFSAVITSDE